MMNPFSREKELHVEEPAASKVSKSVKKPPHSSTFSDVYRKGLVIYLASAISICGAVGVTQFLYQKQLEGTVDRSAQMVSHSLALQMSALVQERLYVLDQLAQSPEFIQSMPSSLPLVQDYTKELHINFPMASKIMLFSPEITAREPDAAYGLTYAALTLVRATTKEQATRIEIHQIGKPEQQIAIAAAVHLPGKPVLGYLLLNFPGSILTDQIKKFSSTDAYFELQQVAGGNAVTIAGAGDKGISAASTGRNLPVAGTSWAVSYWSKPEGTNVLVMLAAMVAALLLFMAGLSFLVLKSLASAMRVDLGNMLRMVQDILTGQPRRTYPVVALSDNLGAFEMLEKMARDKTLRPAVSNAADGAAASPSTSLEDGFSFDEDSFFDEEPSGSSEGGTVFSTDPAIVVKAEIFKAYDIRGVVTDALTDKVVYLIGRAFGSQALSQGQETVVVGRDGRLSGPALSEALIAGLRDSGCHVKNIGIVPTPVTYFATHLLNTGTGIMVTGSHNPPDYNGLKMMLAGTTLSGDDVQALRRRVDARDFVAGQGTLEEVSVTDQYIDRIAADVKMPQPKKVVVDCGNGAAGEILPRLLRKLGCEVIEMYCEIDGNFPNHHPDPSKPENLRDLIAAVAEHKADIGLAFDGDGDRVGVISPDGKIIWPDRIMMLLAMDVLERNPGALIIYDVKCSKHLAQIISEYGGIPLMWNTGHSLIKAKMKETGALLAGEMSGHIFFKERWYGFDDGLYVAARLLEVLSKDHRDAASVFSFLPDSINTPELNIKFPREGDQFKMMQKLLEVANFPHAEVTTIDGLRVDFEDGWGLVRASNTTPSLVLRFEGDTQESLERIQGDFRALLNAADTSLSLPF